MLGSTNNLDTGIAFVYEVPYEQNLKYSWYLNIAEALGKIENKQQHRCTGKVWIRE